MLYKIALFLHVSGALMICAALAIEWLWVINIRKADAIERIKELILNFSKVSKIGDIGAALVLLPGIYMMVTVWHDARWGIFGLVGFVLIALIGGIVTGKKMKKIRNLIKTETAGSQELGTLLKNNSLWFSIKMRTAIFFGIIFLMTVKPGLAGSILTLVISIIIGALPLRMRNYPSVTAAKM